MEITRWTYDKKNYDNFRRQRFRGFWRICEVKFWSLVVTFGLRVGIIVRNPSDHFGNKLYRFNEDSLCWIFVTIGRLESCCFDHSIIRMKILAAKRELLSLPEKHLLPIFTKILRALSDAVASLRRIPFDQFRLEEFRRSDQRYIETVSRITFLLEALI